MVDLAPVAGSVAHASRWGLLALVAGALAIGFSGVWVRLSELGPTATSFHRMALAAPVFWMWWAMAAGVEKKARNARPETLSDYVWLVAAGLFFAADMMVWAWATMLTTVANATLFANFAPIVVTLGAWVLFGERARVVFLAGLALALAGAAVLMGASVELGGERLAGDGLGLLAAVFYGAYLLTVSRLRARFSTVTVMVWTATIGALAILPVAAMLGEGLIATTLAGWAVLIGFAFTGQVGGHWLIAWGLAHLPASFGSVALLVQPVAAAVFAWMVLGEKLGPWQIAGGMVVLAGIALARRGSAAA